MKFNLVIYSLLAFMLNSCSIGCGNEKELAFDSKTLQLLNIYHRGDTIYFSNQSREKDTIVVSEIEDWTNNCMMHGRSIEIKHIPNHIWGDGHEIKNGKMVPLDQSLIQISREVLEPSDGIYIGYRNFNGKITDSTEIRQDKIFAHLNQFKYWVVMDENSDYKDYKNDSLHVMKVFWTEKYGLTGYELRNGEIFKIDK